MSDDPPTPQVEPPKNKITRYTNDTLTEAQFDEVMQTGSIQSLTVPQRTSYLYWLAKRLDLNPYTRPFDMIPGQGGKLVVYANRTASDQLRQRDQLTDHILYEGPLRLGEKLRDDVYQVLVELKQISNQGIVIRTGVGMGLVGILNLTDEALANAIMKCHTKALRRATLAFCGLGFPDESEVGSFATGSPAPTEPLIDAEIIKAQTEGQAPTPAPEPKMLTGSLPSAKKSAPGAKPLPAAKPPAKVQ